MKKIVLSMLLLVVTILSTTAQNAETTKVNGPEITFTETVFDYGEIMINGDGTHEFEFTNTGNEPLILSQPRSSCGCTVPTWPRQPILPGEKEKIKVTYNTSRAGNFNKTVTILSNSKTNNSIVLRIKGSVAAKPTEAMPEKSVGMGTTSEKK